MRSLEIRNVPDDLIERLELLARAANTSVEAVAIRELEMATRRHSRFASNAFIRAGRLRYCSRSCAINTANSAPRPPFS